MKIAVASSGLGHVVRGIETWALDMASILSGKGVDVVLFAGGRVQGEAPGGKRQGEGLAQCSIKTLDCLKRGDMRATRLVRRTPGFAWRWGFKSTYGWEQFSFWWKLWPELRRGQFDILHVQDPMVADWCRRFRKRGLVNTLEILAHGTEETEVFLSRFQYVQHLAPWHQEQAPGAAVPDAVSGFGFQVSSGGKSPIGRPVGRMEFVIPNFVDTDRFVPADAQMKRAARERLGLPVNAFVAVAVGALKRDHKRVDWLIREFSEFAAKGHGNSRLLLVGASTHDTPALEAEARERAQGRIVVMADQAHDRMPEILACADVFVHAALFEMMPIAFLEAMACGLPIVSHGHPVMRWMMGQDGADREKARSTMESLPCGWRVDMTLEGALAETLLGLRGSPQELRTAGFRARERAVAVYSRDAVMGQYLAMYEAVMRKAVNPRASEEGEGGLREVS